MVATVPGRREGTRRELREVQEVAIKAVDLIVARAITPQDKWGTPTGGEANNIRYSDDGVPHTYCATCRKNSIGERNGWNPTHPTKYHQEAQKPNWSVHTLAAIDPQNKLVLAVQGRGAATGSVAQTAPLTEVSITTAGLTQNPMSAAAQAAAFDRFSSLASSEEVKQTITNLRSALRLN